MGVHELDGAMVVSPFRPSQTLSNILRTKNLVINLTDDVRVFAGSLTGRHDWAVQLADRVDGHRLVDALSHIEAVLTHVKDDDLRPRLFCQEVFREYHRPFLGFNRAQAAVIEGAILVSRLHLLSREKVEAEMKYLSAAVIKTAGPREREAWGWLHEAVFEKRA